MPLVVVLLATGASVDLGSLIPPTALLATSLVAAAYLVYSRDTSQAIALPTSSNGLKTSVHDDPLDIDVELEPDVFYPRLRVKKLALFFVLLLLEGVTLFQMTWDALRGADKTAIIEDVLVVLFWVSGDPLSASASALAAAELSRIQELSST